MKEVDVLRGLVVFEGSPISRAMVPLRRSFHIAWSGLVEALRFRTIMLETFWQSDDPQLLAALLPVLEELAWDVELARDAIEDAVDLGEALAQSNLFHNDGFSVSRTEQARREAFEALTRDDLDRPLPLAYTERLRRRYRAGWRSG